MFYCLYFRLYLLIFYLFFVGKTQIFHTINTDTNSRLAKKKKKNADAKSQMNMHKAYPRGLYMQYILGTKGTFAAN